MESAFEARGVNGQLTVTPREVIISRKGFLAVMGHGLKGEKHIRLENITAVQIKRASALVNGYIQIAFPGSHESKGGLFEATKDENTVMFNARQQAAFLEAKDLIERYQQSLRKPAATSQVEDLERLAALRDKGVLTEEEFQTKKKQILGI